MSWPDDQPCIQRVALGRFQGFIKKMSWQFRWPVGHTTAAVQPGKIEIATEQKELPRKRKPNL